MTSSAPPLRHPLHIFRGVLREASYHPDPAVRSYLKSYARDSFRAQKSKWRERRNWPADEKWQRDMKVMRNARNLHSILQRCNQGYLGPFRKTLSWTYGRSGRRRWPLMRQIMGIRPQPEDPVGESLPPDAPPGSSSSSEALRLPPDQSLPDAVPAASDSVVLKNVPLQPQGHSYFSYGSEILALPARRHRPHITKEIPPMFQSLSKSQAGARAGIPSQTAANMPQGPKLPSTTIWGRPMPECRIRNATLKWFANEAALLYPYLPPEEWAHIRNIALGTLRLTVPARRPTASTWVFTTPDPEPVPSLLAAPRGEPRRYQGKKCGNPHHLTQRFLAHQYEWLLRHVPLLIGGEGEASYGSAPSVPPLANQPQSHAARPTKEAKQEHEAQTADDSTAAQPKRVVLATTPSSQRPRPMGTFLWHSTVLDKPKPLKLKPQQLNAQANKLLFG